MQGKAENTGQSVGEVVQPPGEKSNIPPEAASSNVGVNPVENMEQKSESQMQQAEISNGGYQYITGMCLCNGYSQIKRLYFNLR